MVEPLKKQLPSAPGELFKRLEEAKRLLKRAAKALNRTGWEGGETDSDVEDAITSFLSAEDFEAEIFGAFVPVVVRKGTGRTIPDLTKREHVCEWQREIKTK